MMTEEVIAPMNRMYVIDPATVETYEAGATLLSLLAYPSDGPEDRQRGEAFTSLCAHALRIGLQGTPAENQLQSMKPTYAFRSEKQIDRDLKSLARRWDHRICAAKIGMAFLKEAQMGKSFQAPRGLKRLSVNELCKLASSDSTEQDAENFESRVWRPSLPVIHIATAVAAMTQRLKKEFGISCYYTHILFCPDILEILLNTIRSHEEFVVSCPKLRISADKLVRIRSANE
jgi:hypothetical protein